MDSNTDDAFDDGADIRELNFDFWMVVHARARLDPQAAAQKFRLDRTLVQRVARMTKKEIRRLADTSGGAATHFVVERNRALELLFSQIEANEDAARIECTRVAAIIQSIANAPD
jgi:acetolactate synthase regulatory subunit